MRGLNNSRSRLAVLTVLLVLALGLGAVLAWQAIASRREQQVIVRNTLGDYADFAAFGIATNLYREFGIRVLASFAALPPWSSPSLFRSADADTTGCTPGTLYFEYEPANGSFRRNPVPLPATTEALLLDTLTHSRRLLNEAGWRFRLIRMDLGDAGNGVFIVSTSLPQGFGVRGLSTCLWEDPEFVNIIRQGRALPPSLTGDTPADSLYAASVGTAEGVELYASPAWYAGDFTGSAALGTEFGDLTVSVTLNPGIAPDLVIGEMPDSRVPATIGVVFLSALLLAAAVMLLRHEYRMIAARSDFVSNVSHELRTPLSQILIFTELLKLGRLRSEEERKRSLDIIDKETRRLIRLVENVLQFSRTDAVPAPAPSPLLLARVIEETVEAFRPLAASRETVISVEVPADLAAFADRNGLRQVFLNLLDNAVKYGPQGQTVRVEGGVKDGEVVLAVEDQGPGIPIDDRHLIWEGFRRLQREKESAASGSGIGLSVVKSLVDRMGGRVDVTDSVTGGARFIVCLKPVGEGVAT